MINNINFWFIFYIFCLFFIIFIFFNFRKKKSLLNSLKQLKDEQKELQNTINLIEQDIYIKKQIQDEINININKLRNKKQQEEKYLDSVLRTYEIDRKNEINQILQKYTEETENKKQELNKKYEQFKTNATYATQCYANNIDKCYSEIEELYEAKINKLQTTRAQAQKSLELTRSALQAAAAASLRQREKAEKIQFYKIQITDNQKSDIQKIWPLRNELHDSSLVSKIIWTSYIQKPTADMCNRILQNTTCGIYRITNLITNQCYIGQSVNISQRFKDHIKAGLGINSTNNKLYSAMLKDGVWNFSFELLEECSRDYLNEKEKYWIGMYNSSELGLNGTKGGS